MWILITSDYDRAYHVQQVMEASYDALEYVITPYPNGMHRLIAIDIDLEDKRLDHMRDIAMGASLSYRLLHESYSK